MKDGAKREATLLVREAELQGDNLLEEARAEEAKIKAEILALKRTRRQLAEGLRVTLDMYQRLAERELGGVGGGAAPYPGPWPDGWRTKDGGGGGGSGADSALLRVRVQPRAGSDEVVGW